MKNVIIIFCLALISGCFAIMISGCSANYHLQKSRRHELIAISKGAKVPNDTIYKEIIREVVVPGDSSNEEFDPAFDLDGFENDIDKNDSLVAEINRLKDDSLGTALDKEKTLALLIKANNDLKALRGRIIRGYSKDSTYVVSPDDITTISVRIEKGALKSLNYKRKETTVKSTEMVPIEIRRVFEMGYKPWQVYVAVGGVGLVLLIIGIIVGRLTKRE